VYNLWLQFNYFTNSATEYNSSWWNTWEHWERRRPLHVQYVSKCVHAVGSRISSPKQDRYWLTIRSVKIDTGKNLMYYYYKILNDQRVLHCCCCCCCPQCCNRYAYISLFQNSPIDMAAISIHEDQLNCCRCLIDNVTRNIA